MDMTEIRKFNLEELLSKLKETRKEHMDLRFKKASMQLSDTTQILIAFTLELSFLILEI